MSCQNPDLESWNVSFVLLSPVGVTLYLQLGDALSLQPTLLAWLVHEQIYQQ